MNCKISSSICGIDFKNPVIAASGTFGFGREYSKVYDLSLLGGISTKGTTLYPKKGNIGCRSAETPSGMMNSVGLENPGIKAFVEEEVPFLKEQGTVIIANIGGGSISEYVDAVSIASSTEGIDMIELNISCPNVSQGGMAFGIEACTAREVVLEVRKVCKKPLIVKLSPNARDISLVARAVEEVGADAVSLVNTFSAMKIDIHRRRSIFNNLYAGLSGPAIRPIAIRMVNEVSKSVKIPVIGIGGICSGEDAIEFIMAGASLVQVGTANFMDIRACVKVIEGIKAFVEAENIKDLTEIRGII